MSKAAEHKNPVENFNDAILNYIIESTFYPNDVSDGGGVDASAYAQVIGDAKTHREARNRLLKQVKEQGIDFLMPAIMAYNLDHGSDSVEYGPNAYNLEGSKMEPIKVKQMQIEDVEAQAEKVAQLLGYIDNGEKNGALNSLLKDVYGGDGILQGIVDAHAGEHAFDNKGYALAKSIQEKFNDLILQDQLKRELGFAPNVSMEDVLNMSNGIPALFERAYRAYSRKKDFPSKAMAVVEGLIAPQTAQAMNEGRNPEFKDMGIDVLEALLLGSAKAGKPIAKSVLKSAGLEGALDLFHDAAQIADDKVYSEGDTPIVGSGDYGELADPRRFANVLQAAFMGRLVGRGAMTRMGRSGGKSSVIDEAKDEALKEAKLAAAKANNRLSHVDEFVAEINQRRKAAGQPPIKKETLEGPLKKELERALKEVEKAKTSKTASQVLGSMGRIGVGRAVYNPETAPSVYEFYLQNTKPQK